MAPARFTTDEVAKHNHPHDCWVIVRGSVYNVTEWVPKHPGGPLIYVHAGQDCTQLFDSYHPQTARRVLDKFHVGEVAWQDGEHPTTYKQGTDFHSTLRTRVDNYFRINKLDPRFATSMYVKTAIILSTIVASYYGAFYACTSLQACIACAVMLGIGMGEVGVSIMHDANHGAYCNVPWVTWLMSATLDAVGASSFMWRQQHVVGHHVHTNVEDKDPDIRVSDPDVRRVTPKQPWQPYHRQQHLYLAALYGLLSIKSVLVDDFSALAKGWIGPVRLSIMVWHESLIFWGGKLLFALWFVGLPLAYSPHGVGRLALLWLTCQLCIGWMLAFMFQVAHVTGDVAFLKRDATHGNVDIGWAEAQVATSADFAHGSWFWTHFSGGLNYQVVHHLFPGINHAHYPALAPIVQQTCREFGVPYTVYPTFWAALGAHFKHLYTVGVVKVPSLATVG